MDKLKAKLDKIKVAVQKWYRELDEYKRWALENDGVIDAKEQAEIDRRTEDLTAISLHIAKLERAKGIGEAPKAPQHLVTKLEDIQKEIAFLQAQLKQ